MKAKKTSQNNRVQEASAVSFHRQELKTTLVGCEKANLQLAVSNVNKISNRYQNNEQVSFNVDLDYFKRYGAGIYLFFSFAKRLSVFFIMFAIIQIIPLVYNYTVGHAFDKDIVGGTGVSLARTSIANFNSNPTAECDLSEDASKNHKLANAIPDILVSLLFLGFYLYWQWKSDKLTEQIKETTNFQAYKTLQLISFPQSATQKEIQTYFQQFGTVKEIAPVKNYSEIISYCKEIYEIEEQKRSLEILLEQAEDTEEKQYMKTQIEQMNAEIASLETQALKYNQQVSEETIKYFIVFQNILDRQKALKELKKYRNAFTTVPENFKLNGQRMSVIACHDEPGQIIWENQHITVKSRVMRAILQGLLLVLILMVTFVVISVLNLATPSTSSNLDTSSYTFATIVLAKNETIEYMWCLKNKDASDTAVKSFCSKYISKQLVNVFIGVLISLVIVIVKNILKAIVIKLAHFQRYKSYTEQSRDIMKNLFYTYVSTTVLITLLLQANIFNSSFKNVIMSFVSSTNIQENSWLLATYDDFKPYWFAEIGYKIFLIALIQAIQVPLVNPILNFIMEKIKSWKASNKLTQKSMQMALKPDQFQIEDNYANILLIMFIGLTFSAGMPIIMPICALAFALRYFYFKLTFIRFSCIPKSLDQNLNETMINMLPFALLFHFSFAIWMYGSNYIFTDQDSFFGASKIMSNAFIKRLGNSWYYTLMFFLCAFIIILKIIFYDLIYENMQEERNNEKIPTQILNQCKKTPNKKQNNMKVVRRKKNSALKDCEQIEPTVQEDPSLEKQKSAITKTVAITSSYKMQNNPDYFQVLIIVDRIKHKSNLS